MDNFGIAKARQQTQTVKKDATRYKDNRLSQDFKPKPADADSDPRPIFEHPQLNESNIRLMKSNKLTNRITTFSRYPAKNQFIAQTKKANLKSQNVTINATSM